MVYFVKRSVLSVCRDAIDYFFGVIDYYCMGMVDTKSFLK